MKGIAATPPNWHQESLFLHNSDQLMKLAFGKVAYSGNSDFRLAYPQFCKMKLIDTKQQLVWLSFCLIRVILY